ncbi:MAG: DUF5720 family protein [Eubacteriales bacterium]|nr:DUF5720 family protein [Eubacteriales bacterium]
MDFTKDELNMVYQYGADTKADTLKELRQIQPYLRDRKLQDIVNSTLQKLSSMSEMECQKFIVKIREQFIAERDLSIEKRQTAARQGSVAAGRQREKTMGELLDEARCKSGAEKLAGHDILDLMRFADDTRHMVVFDVLSDESPIGFKGEKTRVFLTANGYQRTLENQTRGYIKILNHAKVYQGHLFYDQMEHDL